MYNLERGKLVKVFGDLVAEINKGDLVDDTVIVNKILTIKRGNKKFCLELLTKYKNCPAIKRNMNQILLDISYSGRLKFYKIKELIADDKSNDYLLMYATDFERLSRKEGGDFRLATFIRLLLQNDINTEYARNLASVVINLEKRKFSNQFIAFLISSGCLIDDSVSTLSSLTETQIFVLKRNNKINPYVFAYQI